MGLDIRGMAPLLQVFDMPTSIAFYCGMLGFEVATTSEPGPKFDWALLRLNGVELMLNTAYERDKRPPAPVRARIAAHDDTCLYFGAPDVDAVHKDLLAKGLNVRPPKVAPYGMKQLYLHDPDGYKLCFQWAASRRRPPTEGRVLVSFQESLLLCLKSPDTSHGSHPLDWQLSATLN